ncbi:MAG: type IV pilus twitching motility protein PilT [Lentisphaeria bacterium]|jgi:twitching motility protein PilT
MQSSLHELLAFGVENEATEWQLPLNGAAQLRMDGKLVTVEDFVLDGDRFAELVKELLPAKWRTDYERVKDDGDFVLESSLHEEEGLGRFLLRLQCQRGVLALMVTRPLRDASVFYEIFVHAVEHKASDIHVRENKFVRLRIDSKLVETDIMTDSLLIEKAIAELVPPGKIEDFTRTGDLDFAWEEEGVGRFRVNLHRQRGMVGMTFRHVKGKAPSIREVNLPEVLKQIVTARNGIIFVSGTTGSGKSTTMAAMLDHLNNNSDQHIITVEDPIEYTYTDNRCFFEQREVGLDAVSFESALVHALRQDPDIIMLGEMRSRTTFETALTAAETGHLVITTLHTKSAPQSISRILDMYPQEEREAVRKSLSENLQAIICQRLAPRATGKGVVPVNEILVNTPIVRKLISENRLDRLGQAIEAGAEDGMMSFNGCLLKLVNNGDITEDVALKFSDNPQALKMNLKGIFLSDGGGIIQ